jgi:hypothetical protein
VEERVVVLETGEELAESSAESALVDLELGCGGLVP